MGAQKKPDAKKADCKTDQLVNEMAQEESKLKPGLMQRSTSEASLLLKYRPHLNTKLISYNLHK